MLNKCVKMAMLFTLLHAEVFVEGAPASFCPTGKSVTDEEDCKKAAAQFGRAGVAVNTWPNANGVPHGCWMFTGSETYSFNTNSGGQAYNSNVTPICLRELAPEYEIIFNAKCEDFGLEQVQTKEECVNAGSFLGLGYTMDTIHGQEANRAQYCSIWNPTAKYLHWNGASSGLERATDHTGQICKVDALAELDGSNGCWNIVSEDLCVSSKDGRQGQDYTDSPCMYCCGDACTTNNGNVCEPTQWLVRQSNYVGHGKNGAGHDSCPEARTAQGMDDVFSTSWLTELGLPAAEFGLPKDGLLGPVLDQVMNLIALDSDFRGMREGSNGREKRAACIRLSKNPLTNIVKEIAKATRMMISIGGSHSVTPFIFSYDWGGSVLFGEDGQFACAELEEFGADSAIIGASTGYTMAISPSPSYQGFSLGGWATASAELGGVVCITVDIPLVEFLEVGVTIDTTKISVDSVILRIMDLAPMLTNPTNFMQNFGRLLLEDPSHGIIAVGLGLSAGIDVWDVIPVANMLPSFTVATCSEELLYCEPADQCVGKTMAEFWPDGTVCVPGISCHQCDNNSEWWWGGFPAEKCGREPRWADGTRCLLGTSCNQCQNTATWWGGPFGHHCGKEPCWPNGTTCGIGTSCHNCCNGGNANNYCPWYWFGVCHCA